jgi:prepilin-type N-terminal cleavage/methylation domain-containing protein
MTEYGEKSDRFPAAFSGALDRGFTLIELLVVISIISMLMSILAPSLKKAREQGRTVACQTNIRQLMFAWNMYAMDNGDRLCSASIYLNGPRPWLNESVSPYPTHHWVAEGDGVAYNEIIGTQEALSGGVLWDFLEMPEVYKCHSHATEFGLSYSISHSMAADLRFSQEPLYTSLADLTTPALKLVFMDSIGITLKEDLTSTYPDIYEMELHGFYPIDMVTQQWNSSSKLITRHNQGTNLGFADLHMGHYKWKDARTTWYDDGRAAMPQKNSETNNPDFDYLFQICKGPGVQKNP